MMSSSSRHNTIRKSSLSSASASSLTYHKANFDNVFGDRVTEATVAIETNNTKKLSSLFKKYPDLKVTDKSVLL